MPRISLIIPAYNEEHYLPRLLESVAAARRRFQAGPDQVEVIVADNASSDRTAVLARKRGCRVVSVAKRAIAAARNGGAAAARGAILAFVDADSEIHPDTFNAIERTLASGRVILGATGIRMSRSSVGIALSMLVTKLILLLGGVDTGVVFCRRSDWQQVGGFNEDRRWAEDVEFQLALKRLGRSRGQRFARARGAPTITAARKFDRYGDWHYFTVLLHGCAWLLLDRARFDRFAGGYWYDRE